MNKRTKSVIVGILILLAYSMLLAEAGVSKETVFVVDLLSGLSVIGISLLMFPIFSEYHKNLSRAYLFFKAVEGILMIIAGTFFLFPEKDELRAVIYGNPHTFIFIIGAALFYYLLYRSKTVPNFLTIWGGVAIFCLLMITVLKTLNLSIPLLESLLVLVISNELFISLRFILKGFDKNRE